ncbi:MAG: glycosyltransferase family 39 protein [Anaerolineales bacterium]|nr:glycosyltransferase family 39 protein [Anaerolineales bacterium]
MTKFRFWKNIELPSWLPFVLAGLGAILYLIQAVIYAHTSVSGLDEGSYLIKGMFYLNGVYEPFEPYGPLTNKAPFAFIIPGIAEYLFGAGLRTGRYFSIFLGLLTMLGTWITARRWAGNWLAALTVWVFALSPMIIKLHARAVSEVIIASMLAWICVLVVGEKRPLWQIVLGSVLAAVAVFTRQNMVPILPFLVLYVFWQHGKRAGIWAFAAGSLALLVFHIYYWPRVMTIWAPWLPESLTPFLDTFRIPTDSVPIWDPNIDFWNRLNAFFQGIRYHFIPLLGSVFGLILLPPRAGWKSAPAMRAAAFLAVSYFVLVLMHGWASLASQYESYSCVFCFSNYLGFFDPLGILFFVIVFAYAWNQNPSRAMQVLIVFLVVVMSTGIGYSLFERVGNGLLNLPIVPRLRSSGLGFIALVDALTQGFGMSLVWVKRWVSSTLGFILGAGVLFAVFLVWKREKKTNFTLTLVNSFLVVGFVLSPVLHLGESSRDCETDIIRDHEDLGAYLASIIPPDSLVYWDGGNAFTPMIYVPQARIFPPQINNGYTFHVGGDPDVLYYSSHWNGELDQRWRSEADIFIIEAKRYADWMDFLTPQEFQEVARPNTSPSCNEGAELRIFQRLP